MLNVTKWNMHKHKYSYLRTNKKALKWKIYRYWLYILCYKIRMQIKLKPGRIFNIQSWYNTIFTKFKNSGGLNSIFSNLHSPSLFILSMSKSLLQTGNCPNISGAFWKQGHFKSSMLTLNSCLFVVFSKIRGELNVYK